VSVIVTSVEVVPGRLVDGAALDEAIQKLRDLFPRAIIDRYLHKLPSFGERVLVAPGAAIVGEVALGNDASVWYGSVLRGDLAPVRIGERTNIQDGSVLHVADDGPCVVGAEVVVGHRAMLHACTIEDGCLIGMQATVLDGCVVGKGSVVGAGAVVTAKTLIPPRSLVLGCPAKVVRSVCDDDERMYRSLAHKYVRLKENYRRDALAAPSSKTTPSRGSDGHDR
jgi:gamma-carbonic anhydrase